MANKCELTFVYKFKKEDDAINFKNDYININFPDKIKKMLIVDNVDIVNSVVTVQGEVKWGISADEAIFCIEEARKYNLQVCIIKYYEPKALFFGKYHYENRLSSTIVHDYLSPNNKIWDNDNPSIVDCTNAFLHNNNPKEIINL